MKKTTDFGFEKIPIEEKNRRIAAVFDSVTDAYDLMNDAMSLGMHRVWKRIAIHLSDVREGQRVLDVAAGTGDLSRLLASKVGPKGQVWMTDINAHMLTQGRNRLIDQGLIDNLHYVRANAECLPFGDDLFDCVVIGFGLRNVTYKERALASMFRVLKPGGRLIILEFSKPKTFIQPLYDAYSFNVIPKLGRWLAHDEASYEYLVESVRMHPDQETLKKLMEKAGFERCDYHNLCFGIIAVHRGWKL